MNKLYQWLFKFLLVIAVLVFLPVAATEAQTTVYQTIMAGGTSGQPGANTNTRLISSVGQPLAQSVQTTASGFYTVAYLLTVDVDIEPPVISLTFENKITKGSDQSVAPVITDNFFNQIAEARIFFRPIGGKSFDSLNLSRNGTTTTYSATLQANKFDAMGIEFYFTAKDLSNNKQRYPTDNKSLYTYVTDKAVVPPSLLSFGDQEKNYRIISVPYSFSENISALLDEFGPNDNTKWRLITYAGSNTFGEYPSDFSTLDRARGYWFIARQSKELILNESISAPANNQAELYEMTLQPEWNQIGNPYTLPVSWENVRTYNPQASLGKLKLYDGSTNEPYKNGDDLLTFQGGFVYLDGTSSVKIKIPFKGQNTGGRKGESQEGGWGLPITISVGDIINRMGGVGMHPLAQITKDRFDDVNPPQFLDFAEINFEHPEHPLKGFCFDVAPELDEYVWAFSTASSFAGPAQLSWEVSDVPSGKEMYLYDEVRGVILNMALDHMYITETGHPLKIYYGTDVKDKIRPQAVMLAKAYPNPFKEEAIISFALPGQHEAYQASIQIFNAQGQNVKTIAEGLFYSGIHQAVWNADDKDALKCAPGLYLYRLNVSKNGKEQVLTERVLLVK